ncbi:DUF4056 domain-containing protein [Salmonella enterica]|nr:DUF4056 domain-containing protein [Salmonella enterica]
MNKKVLLICLLLFMTSVRAALPLPLMLNGDGDSVQTHAWPVMPPLPEPAGLRPCCAFGYNLHVKVLNIPVPFWQLNNIVMAGNLGRHRYNDNFLSGLSSLVGFGCERNGIIYTSHGGFIDTAHVRDSADMTVFLFTHLLPELGQAFILSPEDELAQRRIVFSSFTPPSTPGERYALAAWMAAHIAFQLAAWHEIAQWYGYESVPGFPEDISAFSPEDLYSNLLGTRLAVSLILDGQTATLGMYNAAMQTALNQALNQLGGRPENITRFHFDMLDGVWWNSLRRVPEKFLVLRRNYDVSDSRTPTRVPGEQASQQRLALPHYWKTYRLDMLEQLQLWPGDEMARLPVPYVYYTATDFPVLAAFAFEQDEASHYNKEW